MNKCVGKICPQGKICNPSTKRCVNSNGKIGKTIGHVILPNDKQKRKSPSRSRSKHGKCDQVKCIPDKICNPNSSRCVNRNGKIGKMLIRRSHSSHNKFEDDDKDEMNETKYDDVAFKHSYGKGLDNFITPGYHLIKQLGKGSFGEVFLACKEDMETCKAYKMTKFKHRDDEETLDIEIKMQKKFANVGLAPKIYKSGTFKVGKYTYGIIEMDRVAGTLDDLLKKQVPTSLLDKIIEWLGDIIETMCAHNLVHADFHFGNTAFNLLATEEDAKSNKIAIQLLLIDFGWSCCIDKNIKCIPQLELSQLLRTADMSNMNKHNEKYLKNKLLDLYRENYNPKLKDSTRALDTENNKYFKIYKKDYYKQFKN